ncbi:GL16092 [Drosophila persimilis]|uniref:GL16092 n=1 Tax=Drosophila persimilis TaxID=7234 RepID=B4H5G9_DROPE|nr:GL16092 [Drosophila persimilis]
MSGLLSVLPRSSPLSMPRSSFLPPVHGLALALALAAPCRLSVLLFCGLERPVARWHEYRCNRPRTCHMTIPTSFLATCRTPGGGEEEEAEERGGVEPLPAEGNDSAGGGRSGGQAEEEEEEEEEALWHADRWGWRAVEEEAWLTTSSSFSRCLRRSGGGGSGGGGA